VNFLLKGKSKAAATMIGAPWSQCGEPKEFHVFNALNLIGQLRFDSLRYTWFSSALSRNTCVMFRGPPQFPKMFDENVSLTRELPAWFNCF
jgi:hypothetical protein